MGEGMNTDALIMPFISSANIACGFHAGNSDTIRATIDSALEHGVNIGAHPSFRDREHFGRKEMNLAPDKLYAITMEQLIKIDLVAKSRGAKLHHVKPHGALYNLSARDPHTARIIATAVKDFDESLVLYGLSGSHSLREGEAIGLATAAEVFADRRYHEDGSLVERSHPKALITDEEESVQQVRGFIEEGRVTALNGALVPVLAQTICVHGDNSRALFFVRRLHRLLQTDPLATT